MVVGVGAVGARAARQLHATEGLEGLVIVDTAPARADAAVASLGAPARSAEWNPALFDGIDVVVFAHPGHHRPSAEVALEHGAHVVSVGDAVEDVRSLLDLDAEARERALTVVIGAAFAPGLSCVLARHAASTFDAVDEVHVARAGTGGPACARQHHRALGGDAIDWRDGGWQRRPGGSGRELCWFPDPVGGLDCYRGGLPDALTLVPAFPGVQRVTARVASSRRDRLTAQLPMLRKPHPEGAVGAVRVEVRGRRGTASDVRVLGVMDRPAVAAGVVAAVAAAWAADGRFTRAGAAGLAELVEDAAPFLHDLSHRGVRAAVFEGVG